MADSTKYMPINERTLVSDLKLKNVFSFRTKKTRAFAYVFIAIFVAVTFFLAFNPSPDPSSPWFSSIFTSTSISTSIKANGTTTTSSSSSSGAYGSAGSQFSSIYSYFFPSNSSEALQNSTVSSPSSNATDSRSPTMNLETPNVIKDPPIVQNQTKSNDSNQTMIGSPLSQPVLNQTAIGSPPPQPYSDQIATGSKSSPQHGSNKTTIVNLPSQPVTNQTTKTVSNSASESQNSITNNATENRMKASPNSEKSLPTSWGNGAGSGPGQRIEDKITTKNVTSLGKKQGFDDLVKNLVNCNLFDGDWVRDDSYPLYKPGSCSLIDEQFNCFSNGRPDLGFQNYKWKPNGCSLPRLDGSKMLKLLKGKRLVFVGDSLNRNMWESLVCILRNSLKDQTKVYEASGRHHFRSEASYSFVFKDYDCTVEFFVAPFLVQEWEIKDKNGTQKETLRLDLISSSADQYKTADVVVFNTGHWWTHDKTSKGEDYYQEGNHVYKELNVLEAFRKAMTTWGNWVDANMNPKKTSVFFRGYSASHFSGGQWNSGGACDHESEPIKNTTYLTPYPDKMIVLEKVFKGMKNRVSYLNITRLTDFRKDGHPSVYRKKHYTAEEIKSPLHYQDCSHWCLPGVPDAWNEILYAQLLVKQYQNQQQKL
ncbi:protein trichome birefringence [Lactuca sativa]|uniref:Trichome birefringence-like N-terminal domain-containing protein n=1 Tax=Lactuca sativa TaxID=4236 RepID=A0A9R1WXP5_LACSA|nr:protein trichome birefringence [Lactuca sativa]KAJ0191631.1 hypothetical protein LSAT_V11C800420180 [Lactuca sativa]